MVATGADTRALEELRQLLEGDPRVVVDPDLMAAWSRDQSPIAPDAAPLAVVRARSVDDVVAALQWAQRHGVAVVTRGAGTGLTGGANALAGCLVLSVAEMDRIVSIDPARRLATVQPGVINGALDRAAAAHGLRYAPDPGSRATCTIGGNIATNAGGMACCKYGVTADHVAALTVVLADGEVVRLGGATRKNVAGLDLLRLMIGSEGTLGVIVEASVRLLPAVTAASTVAASFASLGAAMEAVVEIGGRLTPAAVELMDRTTVAAVEQMAGMGLDTSAEALLLVVCDGSSAAAEAEQVERIARGHGAGEVYRTDDLAEGEEFMAARRLALPALERQGSILLDDVGVPPDALPAMVVAIEQIAVDEHVTIGTFGHAADGNLHPTIVFDATDPDQRRRAETAFERILHTALAHGGTITGEHGVGALKLPFLAHQVGRRELDLMRKVRAVFDPEGRLNPGRGC
ncbi:FAD-binding oxidoreductase [Nocardioides sp.]|uniref:FAD-binding oxidoreductase n=1 Tax=Nocardioides sp. TaxID=35761 RepID=UPI0035111702